ncbi:hypothetical protein [Chenggangzhangella methanolivorans]|uniref:Uncharacterized protein n=1 Tax=Chenggangzhangella methanolivorans TaxID=1437009 RepID=A0A9E6R798_9HYPH|nr:hypothetical protein [Chenggangzhangella methanolivorans]QZN99530.1 hypothetical protein K6K41_22930 [Chenggangzhangella methanolivorans]
MTKKRMTIEQALGWAYRQELPKAHTIGGGEAALASSWGAVSAFGALLASVDAQPPVNGFGCVIDMRAWDAPHPDAVRIGEAVERLDAFEVALPAGWDPLGDFGGTGDGLDGLGELGREAVRRGLAAICAEETDAETGEVRLVPRTRLSRLVAVRASLGGAPDWRGEKPAARLVSGPKGRALWFRRMSVAVASPVPSAAAWEVEADGWDEKRRRPFPGAYQKWRLDPDPAGLVAARGEYELWRAGLDMVLETVREGGGLDSVELCESGAPLRPWETGEAAVPRVLRAIRSPEPEPVSGRRKRRARGS